VQLKYTHRNQNVVLARKQLKKGTLEEMRQEAKILEDLCHDHIVKLVGTYTYHFRALYLILWPAATCDLAELLNDINNLRFDEEDREDILERLARMDLADTRSIDNVHAAGSFHDFYNDRDPLNYLQRILGCLTAAVHYCHTSRVRHLDLKPKNVLVSPGRVYLADFGISRDVKDVEHTMTFIEVGSMSWLAPERDPSAAEALSGLLPPPSKLHPVASKPDGWSMKAADIYSLGLVFLDIATILYGSRQSKLFDVLKSSNWRWKLEQLDEYLAGMRSQALVTQVFADENAHTCSPRHILGLIRSMLYLEPTKRPSAAKINEELVSLGGIEQVYHNSCCKVPARMLTRLLDKRYAQVFDERTRLEEENRKLQNDLQILKAAKETVESRLKSQKETHDRDWKSLAKQLEDEKERRHQLEASRRPRPGVPPPERGGTRKPPRQAPSQRGKPTVSAARAKTPRHASPKPAERPSPDMRKSSDSLNTFMLHTQSSWCRVRPPVKPTTPSRSGTPITPGTQESTLTNTTDNSVSSSILSRGSRCTASSGLSPNPSPCGSRVLSESNRTVVNGDEPVASRSSYFQSAKSQSGSVPPVTPEMDNQHDDGMSEHDSTHESVSQQGTVDSDLPESTKAAIAKSWALVAGDRHGLASMIGAAEAAGKKKKKKA
jgi:serine/threonine protein kinase